MVDKHGQPKSEIQIKKQIKEVERLLRKCQRQQQKLALRHITTLSIKSFIMFFEPGTC